MKNLNFSLTKIDPEGCQVVHKVDVHLLAGQQLPHKILSIFEHKYIFLSVSTFVLYVFFNDLTAIPCLTCIKMLKLFIARPQINFDVLCGFGHIFIFEVHRKKVPEKCK